MNIDLDDTQKKRLLEIVAMAHMIEFMKGNDNSDIEILVSKIADALLKEGKMHIFNSVFKEVFQK